MAVTQATELADFSSGIGTAGAILEVDNVNNKIGIGTTNPQALLQVGQIIKMDGATGIITATTFAGSFSGNATGLSGTPDITVNNIVAAAATFSGEVTYEDVTNIDSIGIVTARAGVDITGGSLTLTDSIIHSSDTNTKIRFPSVDTFTVETAGVERFRVGSTGTVGVAGLSTAKSFGGFNHLSAPFGGGTVSFTVTVASKTADHRYNGSGSSNAFLIDGVQSPFLTLTPGRTYRFVNDNTGSHPLKFYLESNKTTEYSTGVTFDNAYTEIVVSDSTPTILHYQCTNHSLMGNSVQVNSNIAGGLVGTPDIDVATLSSTGDVDIADKIVHTGDTNTAIRFPAVDTFTVETGGAEQFRIGSDGLLTGKGAQFNSNITPSSGNGIEIFASTSTLGFIQAFDRTNSSQNNLTIKGNSISLVGGSSEVIGISSGATASFAGDLSIADKIIHTGDTNTAIRFPSADTFTVETGGTERLRVDSDGIKVVGATQITATQPQINFTAGGSAVAQAGQILVGENGGGGDLLLKTKTTGGTLTTRLTVGNDGTVNLPDNGKFTCGAGDDLQIYADGTDSYIDNDEGDLLIRNTGDDIIIRAADDVLIQTQGSEGAVIARGNGTVELYHDNALRLATTADGADFSGTGSIKVPVGTTAQRSGSPTAGDFRYNSTTGAFEGYTSEWGSIGGSSGITTAAQTVTDDEVHLALSSAQDHKITATGICTIFPGGGTEADSHTVRIINSGIATVGFSTQFLFPSGSAPSLPTADGAISLISFTINKVGVVGIATELLAGASVNFS